MDSDITSTLLGHLQNVKSNISAVVFYKKSFELIAHRLELIEDQLKELNLSQDNTKEATLRLSQLLSEFCALLRTFSQQDWYLSENIKDIVLSKAQLTALNDKLSSCCSDLKLQPISNFNVKKDVIANTANVDLESLAERLTTCRLYAEQESMFRYLLRKTPNEPLYATFIAEAMVKQKMYDEAESFFQQALYNKRRLLGEDHPSVVQSLNSLAKLYEAQEKLDKADPLYKQALNINRKMYGEDHQDTAMSLISVADIYYRKGCYLDAQPLYSRALQILRKILGDNSQLTMTSMNKLLTNEQMSGTFDESNLELCNLAHQNTKKFCGESSLEASVSAFNLGCFLYSQKRANDAETLFNQSLSIKKLELGENHPETNQVLYWLGLVYENGGKLREAERLLSDLVVRRRTTLGEAHRDTVTTMGFLELVKEERRTRVVHEGWLKKKGEKGLVKTFKKRWFTLDGEKLKYYAKQGDENSLKGFIMLNTIMDTQRPSGNIFYICTFGRVYEMQAESKQDLEAWTEKLNAIAESNRADGYAGLRKHN